MGKHSKRRRFNTPPAKGDSFLIDTTKRPPITVLRVPQFATGPIREHVKPRAETAIKLLKAKHCLACPIGKHVQAFIDSQVVPVSKSVGVFYFKYEPEPKAGLATNVPERQDGYYEEEGVRPELFILFRLDSTEEELDQDFRLLTQDLQGATTDDEDSIKSTQRHLFETIRGRGGLHLGVDRQLALQLIEIGVQKEFGLTAMMGGGLFFQQRR